MMADDWRVVKVISGFKKGDKTVPSNCRGINLINTTYKLHGKIINGRLSSILNFFFFFEEYAEFRKGQSCTDDVLSLEILIEQRRDLI